MGNPAAGHTTSEEPIEKNKSQSRVNCSARSIASAGMAWPKETVAVLMYPPQAQSGARCAAGSKFFAHPSQLVALGAIEAHGVGGVTVQLDDIVGRDAGGLVQIVDVLGDEAGNLAGAVEPGERPMPAAGLGPREILFHGEAPPPGFVAHLAARQEVVERDRLVLGP